MGNGKTKAGDDESGHKDIGHKEAGSEQGAHHALIETGQMLLFHFYRIFVFLLP